MVHEDDLVVGIAQQLGNGVEAYRCPLVQVIAVAVVTTVEDY
jgi:hypothetical protein